VRSDRGDLAARPLDLDELATYTPTSARNAAPAVPGNLQPPRNPSPSKRSKALRVLDEGKAGTFEPLPGLPAGGRAECRNGPRPCRYTSCSAHLWRIDAMDRGGNPRTRAEDSERGWGELVAPQPTLRPGWLEVPVPPSCVRDLAERGALEFHAIADALDVSVRTVYGDYDSVKGKLRGNRELREHADVDEDEGDE
jgi:hypothetical protein